MWPLLASLLLAMQIHATGGCPGAVDVERQLGPLLGVGTAARTSDVAAIRQEADGTLLVSLDDADGRLIGARRLPRAGTCGEQAQTVAVMLAIWEAQIHPEISLRLDRLSPGPAAPAETTILRRNPPAPPPPSSRTALSLGLGVAGDWRADGWAPAVRVELGLAGVDARWRPRVAVIAVGQHTREVPPGQARWRRASFSLGIDYDIARGPHWAAVLGAGALAGVASISGAGYAENRDSRSVDAGGELRARGEWRPGRLRPWLGVTGIGWLRRQTLELQGIAASSSLPRFQALAGLGADFVW